MASLQANDIFDLADPYFDSIGDEESLPLCCTAVRQDKQGFIWIGTQKGLVRYDGYRFTNYSHSKDDPDTIAGNYILSLFNAGDDRVWIGTVTSGVSVYDAKTNKFTTYQHDPENGNSLSNNRVFSIAEEGKDNYWFATRNGLNYFNEKTQKFTHYQFDEKDLNSISDNVVHSLLIDRESTLWVGTNKGLDRFDPKSKSFERVSAKSEQFKELTSRGVTSLFQARDGKLWVGTKANGVVWINPQDGNLNTIPTPLVSLKKSKQVRIKSITQPTDKEIWLGSFGDGIYVINAQNGELIKHLQHDQTVNSSINFNHIGELAVGDDGLVWVATWGGGLNRYNPANAALRVIKPSSSRDVSLVYPDVSSILELKNGDVWLGSHGDGIQIINPIQGEVTTINVDNDNKNGLTDGFITGLAQFEKGEVWIGTRKGLQRFSGNNHFNQYTTEHGLPDNYIRKMTYKNNTTFWVATDTGLVQFNLQTNKVEDVVEKDKLYQTLSSETISSLAQMKGGTLWIGTSNGLFLLAPNETKLQRFLPDKMNENSISHHSITGLMVDSNDTLWVDTTIGLEKLASWDGETAKFESINQQMNQPRFATGGNIQEDSMGRIWSQSAMIDPNKSIFVSLGRSDGVDLGTFWINAYEKTKNGSLLYGGTQGLLVVRPELYKKWDYQPTVIVSEIKVAGKKQLGSHTKIDLDPLTKSFSVEFSSTDLSGPDKIKYAYYLEGYDDDWIETDSGHRVINYTNLDPGRYNLQIKSSNRLGEWSDKKYQLEINQLPAWFQTLWFKSIFTLLLIAIIFLLITIRVRGLKKQRRELRSQVKQRTKELEIKNLELKRALTHLEEISLTDQSTTAYNRRFINKFIEQDLSKLKRDRKKETNSQPLSFGFVIIDIDHFKYVNDAYGHSAGDQVLRQFVDILHNTCRESDWVVRWGGEEFLVVARYVEKEEITQLAERIRVNVENHYFELEGGQKVQRTCSIGTVAYPFVEQDIEALSWEQTLNLADLAMYIAKNNSRNLWVSLTEKNIKNPVEFYQSAIVDLGVELSKKTVELNSSAKGKLLKYKNNTA